jgi:tetratricopeptide (TPR) repeat protein/predicted Ser/Thr protein kinase
MSIREDNDLLGAAMYADTDRIDSERAEEQPVDGYELLRELHRGGQGVVFEAKQLSTHRIVAIKMLLQGRFATSKQRLRFDREVELVAGLQHPGIVTLFESGSTSNGDVYFAMEFVKGYTLDKWVLTRDPDLQMRVVTFADVCCAVQYAHGRGIIHRDLKPGNILVDDDDRAQILDFGIARATDSGADPENSATVAGEFLGTYSYAAPEQLEGDPDRIDVRTDVFALGVILYELLTNERPFETGKSLAELIQNRLDTLPPSPSRLASHVDRDLDVICLKALAPDIERRYASAGELEEDLRRHLDGRPILARADSTSYVLGRAIRRHKIPFAAAVAIVLLAIGSAIGFAILFADAEHERGIAEETLRGFQDSIGLINPETGQGTHDMSVNEYIALMQDHVENDLQSRPRIASALLTTLGLIELAFDDMDRAYDLLSKALELRADGNQATLGEAHHNLGRVAFARREYQAALAHYEIALQLRTDEYGPVHEDVAMTLQHLGSTRRRMGEFSAAEAYYSDAEAAFIKLFGPASEQLAGLRNNRAWVQIDQAREAEKAGESEEAQRRYEIALVQLREASTMVRGAVAPNDYRVGRTEGSIAKVLASLGRHDQALPRYDEAERILLSRRGEDSDDSIKVIQNRALSRLALGVALEETAEELAHAAEIRESQGEQFDSNEPWERAAYLWELLGQVHDARGDQAAAADAAEREARARMHAHEVMEPAAAE